MASTNKTTNLELSQFVGTDKPAWLTDYNADMGKIDTAVAGNTANIATNTANIATLNTNLSTTDTKADTAVTTANSAASVASDASTQSTANTTAIAAINRYLNLTGNTNPITITTTSGTINTSTSVTEIRSAKNPDGTLGKVYGQIRVDSPSAANCKITISDTGLRPTQDIIIKGLCRRVVYIDNGTFNYIASTPVKIKTNGTVEIDFVASGSYHHVDFELAPCLLFMINFGD